MKKKLKVAAAYFSKNELFCLQVGYGISSLKSAKDNEILSFYVDANEFDKKANELMNFNPELVVIFVSFHSFEILESFCHKVKINMPKVKIAICNNLASALAKQMLWRMREIDIAVVGEFEAALVDVCNNIILKEDFRKCKGIAYIEGDKYIENAPRELISIENIMYPDREEFVHNTRYFHILGSRGCERNCSFCDRNYLFKMGCDKNPRFRSVEDILNEVDFLVDRYNCKMVNFYDSSFCSNENILDRLEQFYNALKKRSYWVQFSLCLRAEQINKEVGFIIDKLQTVGLGKVFLGIESFNEQDIKIYNKSTTINKNEKAIKILNSVNRRKEDFYLNLGCGFINFNPYTTFDTLKQNLYKLRYNGIKLNPYILSTKESLNYLSSMTKQIDKDGLLDKKIEEFSLKELMERRFNYTFSTSGIKETYDLIVLCKKLLEYKNITGAEFIRNRYIYFYGYDKSVEKYDRTYDTWLTEVDTFSYKLFHMLLYGNSSYRNKKEQVICMCGQFKERYLELCQHFRVAKRRVSVQLMKIDELIYNVI